MRQILLALAIVATAMTVAMTVAMTGAMAETPASQSADIRATITGQIEAFGASDFAAAFDFASDGIRRIFGNSDTFARMVERGYAMVIAPAEVQFGDVREEGGGRIQRVLIRDGSGVWSALDYLMVEQHGGWRIGGVELLAPPAIGA